MKLTVSIILAMLVLVSDVVSGNRRSVTSSGVSSQQESQQEERMLAAKALESVVDAAYAKNKRVATKPIPGYFVSLP
jgi:hypothetical protein